MYITTQDVDGYFHRKNNDKQMKYKVWGKAKSVLKPDKKHHASLAALLFIAGLLLTIALVIRLTMLYLGTVYTGVREPYIQLLTTNSVIIRWQAEDAAKVRVEAGKTPAHTEIIVEEPRAKLSHEIQLNNLRPATRYYYRLYHDNKLFRGGAEYWFETAPEVASVSPVRIWLMGDPGRPGTAIRSVQAGMTEWLSSHPRSGQSDLNLIVSTGDSAYYSGTNEEYQRGLFDIHQQLFKNVAFWPVYGNHEAKGWSFFNIFSLPKNAEAGGVASATEHYYSVDYGSLHMVFLDSNDGGFSANDSMISWLKKDLQTTRQKWLVVFMHHPPYSRGHHNSNDPKDSGNRMFNMRMRVNPVLEKAGVDLVISGHSHSYERSYLLNCHYGVISAFEPQSIVQKGPVFTKPAVRAANQGVIYTVLGSSAKAVKGRFDHPAMAVSKAILGSMILDIDDDKLVARFIDTNAQVLDRFEIIKSEAATINTRLQQVCQ
ncbi:MAG: metallophosphoesterase family protein [Gammaproteobacteria bacterium]|nr:metallophosphoesterase family protein [Gammaproteobacteria bacterium]